VGFWTACEVKRPESRNAADAAIASRASAGSSVRELIAHPPFGRPRGSVRGTQYNAAGQAVKPCASGVLLRDDLRAVAAEAVVGRVLVVVRQRVEAGEALESARPAGG